MEIRVDVGNVDLTSQIGEHYIQVGEDEWDTRPATLGDAVAKILAEEVMKGDDWRTLRSQVTDIRKELVREQLAPIVAEALLDPVQLTDSYGSPLGKVTTLTAMIMEQAKSWLTSPGDYRGKSQAATLIADEVQRVLKNELAAVIRDEKAKVVAAVQASAATLIADAVRLGIGR